MSPSVQSAGWYHWSLCLLLCKAATAPVCGLLPGSPATQGTTYSFQTELPALNVFLNNPSRQLAAFWCVPGLRYSFFCCVHSVLFFELAWAVEIGAAESPTKNVFSLPMSSVSCVTVWNALKSVCFCGTQSPWGFLYWEALWLLWEFCLQAPLHHAVKKSDVHSHQHFELSRLYPKSVERLLISAMGFTQGANLSDRCMFLLLWNDAFLQGWFIFFFFLFSFCFNDEISLVLK